MQKGIIVRSTGIWYQVRLGNGEQLRCRIVGKIRLKGVKTTNPVAVGDEVEIELEDEVEGTGLIKNILPRRNQIIRQSPRKKHQLHLIAANVDQAVVIVTVAQPKLKQGFIDRFLLMTEPYNIPTTIIFNKADVYSEDDLLMYEYLKEVYEKIGYNVLLVSAIERTGIEEFRALLKDKTSLIGGQSGVGKSTLVNAVQPSLELKTSVISDYNGKGQHTTTFAEMHDLEFGGYIIDSPGIKTLSFNNLEPLDVAHNFREIFEMSENCKFNNCMHLNEPKCAVKDAVESEEISGLRYNNYVLILEEVEGQNYWERHD